MASKRTGAMERKADAAPQDEKQPLRTETELAYKSIVISGTPVSGKSTLSAALSEHYGWKIHSIGSLWRARYAEKYPKGEVSFEEFWSKTTPEDNWVLNEQAKSLFENGGIIGESRYVSYLDASKCLLVFVDADINIRAERAAKGRGEYSSMPVYKIVEILERREADELRVGQELFGVDYRDPKGYHIVLNSGLMTVNQEARAVMELMRVKR